MKRPRKPDEEPPARSDARPPTVLVVDDFADNRQMYAEYLAFAGYGVAEAENGQEALAQALAMRPDVIVIRSSVKLPK